MCAPGRTHRSAPTSHRYLMNSRKFIKMAGAVAAAAVVLPDCRGRITTSEGSGPEVKLLLRGGKSFYQNKWQSIDVGIDAAGEQRFWKKPPAPPKLWTSGTE